MANTWKIAPGRRANQWDMCYQEGCILLGWAPLPDYREFKSKKLIEKALSRHPGYGGAGAAQSIWSFLRDIQPSDIVIANKGRSSVVGIGVVKSGYLPPSSAKNPSQSEDLPHARLVQWVIDKPVDLEQNFFGVRTVHSLTPEKVGQIKQAYLKKYPKLKKTLDQLLGRVLTVGLEDSPTRELLKTVEKRLSEKNAFDPKGIKDARERILSAIVRRRGQPAFRSHLLAAYKGRCAITGCEVEAVLEAVHIIPYKGAKTNHPGNGLLLRADLHTLFDLGLVAVDSNMHLMVSRKLAGTPYDDYHGKEVMIPDDPANQASRDALKQHRSKAVFVTEARRRTRR